MPLDFPILHDVTWMCLCTSSGCTCWAISVFRGADPFSVGVTSARRAQPCACSLGWRLWVRSCAAVLAPGRGSKQTPCFAGSGMKFDHQHRGICEVIQESYFHSECWDNAPPQSGRFAALCVQDERGKVYLGANYYALCELWGKNFLCLNFMENPYSEW